jgi:hypothetical protein
MTIALLLLGIAAVLAVLAAFRVAPDPDRLTAVALLLVIGALLMTRMG